MKITTAKKRRRIAGSSIREKNIARFARKTAKFAIKKAAKDKVTITVARSGKVYQIHPDGRTVKISNLPKKVTVSNPIIKLSA